MSHTNEIGKVVQWRYDESEEIKILRGGLGHKPIIIPPKNPVDLEDYKIILLTHIETRFRNKIYFGIIL